MIHPDVVTTIADLRARLDAARAAGRRIALVPTMGSLHDGHLSLVEHAAAIADEVVVSIFVNPLQFGPTEDFEQYPRDLERDRAALAGHPGTIVFAPAVDEMYPLGASQTRVTAGAVGGLFEGRSRPGHFDGMLTVVAKLLNIVQPDAAVFGQKDAQQVHLVQRMVRELDIRTRIEVAETVRADDGLALSSRNAFLDERQRRAARSIPLALEAAQSAGDRGIDAVLAAAQGVLMGEPAIELDYFAVVDPATFRPVPDEFRGVARALVAARVGSTRLIDTETLVLG
ncbi:pantoate--beta-alanine ligase [Microcella daejeonensis]|uniref:Pantothenate synthetase n=1 Tax=Microcella daejeonensis TaxID=2994971 RepID=A0A9E8MM17_9MICO|nr:pantoate--beta-alanine ligase [Microcella daejeonensis]WAB82125.1 pantoate--beta-alanine ligase [Microcella daejeonensis]